MSEACFGSSAESAGQIVVLVAAERESGYAEWVGNFRGWPWFGHDVLRRFEVSIQANDESSLLEERCFSILLLSLEVEFNDEYTRWSSKSCSSRMRYSGALHLPICSICCLALHA
jgi:hypothetical protein